MHAAAVDDAGGARMRADVLEEGAAGLDAWAAPEKQEGHNGAAGSRKLLSATLPPPAPRRYPPARRFPPPRRPPPLARPSPKPSPSPLPEPEPGFLFDTRPHAVQAERYHLSPGTTCTSGFYIRSSIYLAQVGLGFDFSREDLRPDIRLIVTLSGPSYASPVVVMDQVYTPYDELATFNASSMYRVEVNQTFFGIGQRASHATFDMSSIAEVQVPSGTQVVFDFVFLEQMGSRVAWSPWADNLYMGPVGGYIPESLPEVGTLAVIGPSRLGWSLGGDTYAVFYPRWFVRAKLA